MQGHNMDSVWHSAPDSRSVPPKDVGATVLSPMSKNKSSDPVGLLWNPCGVPGLHGGSFCILWGSFGGSFGNGRLGDIYFVQKNEKMNAQMSTNVLQKHLHRSMAKTGCSVFMQDGAPCHKAKSVMKWLDDQDVSVLEWVGQSPDANPIENAWTKLKSIIRKYPAASNLDELTKNIKRGWKELGRDTDYLERLTNSMTNRVQAIIAAEGDVTKY